MLKNHEELVEEFIAEPAFEIKIGDRILPSLEERCTQGTQTHSAQVSSLENSLLDLRSYLASTVDSHFAACKSILNAITLKEAVETYAKILHIFDTHRAEWQTFCRSLIVIQGSFAGEGDELKPWFESELNAWHSEILDDLKMGGVVHTSRVTAELAARPLDEFRSSLNREFEQLKRQFVSEMLDMLIQLVGLEAIGLVEWFANDKCTYSSYVRECAFTKTHQATLSSQVTIEEGRWKRREKVEIAREGKRTLVRRTQHLVEAKECKVGESKVTVPREQLEFLTTIPQWLSPSIRIVEGMLIRETVVAEDLGVQKFTSTEDRVQWHNDPAITLGPFVLSAWGEAEILREEQRQADAKLNVGHDANNPKDVHWPWNKVTGFSLLLMASTIIQVYPTNRFSVLVGFAIGWIAAIILGTQFSAATDKPAAPVGDDKTSQLIATYAACGATLLLISTLLNAHGYYLLMLPILAISSSFGVLYIKATRGWNVATAMDE